MLRVHLKPPSDYILACPSRATLSHGYQNDSRHKKYTIIHGCWDITSCSGLDCLCCKVCKHVCHCDLSIHTYIPAIDNHVNGVYVTPADTTRLNCLHTGRSVVCTCGFCLCAVARSTMPARNNFPLCHRTSRHDGEIRPTCSRRWLAQT